MRSGFGGARLRQATVPRFCCALRPASCVRQILVMFPLMVWQLCARRAAEHQVAWFVAGLFVLVAVPMSVHDGG